MTSVQIRPQTSSVFAKLTPGVDRNKVGIEALEGAKFNGTEVEKLKAPRQQVAPTVDAASATKSEANPLQPPRERYVRDTQGDGGIPLDRAFFARPANRYIALCAAILASPPARADDVRDLTADGPLGFAVLHDGHWDQNGIHVDPPQSVPEASSPFVLLTAAGAGVVMRRNRKVPVKKMGEDHRA